MGAFGSYQNEIYLGGLGDDSARAADRPHAASSRLPASACPRRRSATSRAPRAPRRPQERTELPSSRGASSRGCCATSQHRSSVTVLGTTMPAPVALAPIGVRRSSTPTASALRHEPPLARDCRSWSARPRRRPSRTSLTASGEGPRWYQLYWPKDSDLAVSFLERAARAGYRALVLTLDTPRWDGGRATSTTRSCRSFAQSGTRTTSPTRCSSAPSVAPSRRRIALPRCSTGGHFGNPALTWERPRRSCVSTGAGRSRSRGSFTRTTRAVRRMPGWTGRRLESRRAPGGRGRRGHWMRCRPSWTQWATGSRCSWTAA